MNRFCTRSLLRDNLNHSLIDKIPGRQNDRKTLLGELNWIFTAVTDTIAWNVLPHDLFQRLFRQDLLVASLFRNFLLAERIMRSANCSPVSYPKLPSTHQHHMWDAWDMAAELCLTQLPALLDEPNAEFQPSPFFTEQLTASEVWLDHGSEDKKSPEQLPIVLQSSFLGRASSSSLPSFSNNGSSSYRSFIFSRSDSNSRSGIPATEDSSDVVEKSDLPPKTTRAKFISSQSKVSSQSKSQTGSSSSLLEVLRRPTQTDQAVRNNSIAHTQVAVQFAAFKSKFL